MRILIISDVHGNLPALEYVLEKEKDADLVVSLGDVVNYGPWSNECVDKLASLDKKALIRGNHEEAFLSGKYPGDHPIAKTFFEYCYPHFSRKQEIAEYVDSFAYQGFDFVHTIGNSYIFPDSEVQLTGNTFIGHSHRMFKKEINGFTLVNVGSVGQNRVDPDEINYALWDTDSGISLVAREFSADSLISEMRHRNYPEACINYILSKRNKKNDQ